MKGREQRVVERVEEDIEVVEKVGGWRGEGQVSEWRDVERGRGRKEKV